MRYGLIGEKLGHSYSREIHGRIADYPYALRELSPEALGPFLGERDFRAVNVTIPYKEKVIPYLDAVSPEARRIGAVNTVVNRDGRLTGYNTDFAGMRSLISRTGLSLTGRKVLILGTGGTAKTALAVTEALGAASVFCVSRTGREGALTYEQAVAAHTDAAILLNATPVGMFPEEEGMALDPAAFPRLEAVLDAVYHPLRTDLVLAAQARGIPAYGGLMMLAAQAVEASALFLGKPADPGLAERIFRVVALEKANLTLIGMPGAGKTMVGRILAQRTGKRFVDTDAVITERIGVPIAAFFAREGEAAFRVLERETVAELARQEGCVIATGGGAVLDRRNVRALKHGGPVIFLDRPLEALEATADRPLSSNRDDLQRLYEKRYPLYCAAADIRQPNDGTAEDAAAALERRLIDENTRLEWA